MFLSQFLPFIKKFFAKITAFIETCINFISSTLIAMNALHTCAFTKQWILKLNTRKISILAWLAVFYLYAVWHQSSFCSPNLLYALAVRDTLSVPKKGHPTKGSNAILVSKSIPRGNIFTALIKMLHRMFWDEKVYNIIHYEYKHSHVTRHRSVTTHIV